MNKKLAIRTLLLLVSIAAIVAAYQALTVWAKDWGGGKAETVGVIAALEETKNGARVVAIEPSGNKRDVPGGNEVTRDIDFSWGADGSHIYLSTNRDPLQKSKEGGSYNIFRWKFGSNEVEPLTDQRRTMSAPRFFTEKGSSVGVVIAGGRVLEFLPASSKSTMTQIMPPINKDRAAGGDGEGASESSTIYARYGNSFRQAFYLPGHYSMLAVMSRDDAEVLVYHDFRPDENGRIRPPVGLLAGSKIQLDMAPDGQFVVSQQDATVPDRENVPKEWMKDGKLFPNLGGQPYHHMLWIGKLDATGMPSSAPVVPPTIKPEEEVIFLDPKMSPDGNSVAVVVANRPEPSSTVPQGLVLLNAASSKEGPRRLVQGPVLQPSWSPDGKSLLFTMPDNGQRAIYEIQADGSNPRKVIGGGNFSYPIYSPQIKKA